MSPATAPPPAPAIVASKAKGLLWIAGTLLVAVAVARGLPLLAHLVPWSWEEKVAGPLGGFPALDLCDAKPPVRELLARVVRRLYPRYPEDASFPVTVEVLGGDTENAFASLGGHIYVYEGLLAKAESADELAGVLAHEIEHVRRRHIIEGVFMRLLTQKSLEMILSGHTSIDPGLAVQLLNMKFGRGQEAEADDGGLRRLRDARVDVDGFRRFFERLAAESTIPTLLSDHPSPDSRAETVKRYLGGPHEPVLDVAEWKTLQGICRTP